MGNEFIISRAGGRGRAEAISDRGKAFAAAYSRFDGNEADLDQAEAEGVYQKIHAKGDHAGVPNGLPAPDRRLLYARPALLLASILIPIMILVPLI